MRGLKTDLFVISYLFLLGASVVVTVWLWR